MDSKEFHKYSSWCHLHNIRFYAVTEFEYQVMLISIELEAQKITQQEFQKKRSELLIAFQNSKQLHIAMETNGMANIGEKIFYSEAQKDGSTTVSQQIELLYKLKYQKENKEVKPIKF